MKTYFVSDLHLCDGGPRDRFAWGGRPKRFNDFLDFVGDNRLIIGGDLFDLWQSNVSKALLYYDPLLQRFDKMQAEYIVGNHDFDLVHFIGQDYLNRPFFKRMTGPILATYPTRVIKFVHGHESDKYCRDETPGFSHLLTIITGMLADYNGGPMKGKWTVEQVFVGTLEKLLRFWQWWNDKPIYNVVAGLKSARLGDETIVAGHTHEPGSSDWYYNSGCWCAQTDSFIEVAEDGTPTVFDWVDGPKQNTVRLAL